MGGAFSDDKTRQGEAGRGSERGRRAAARSAPAAFRSVLFSAGKEEEEERSARKRRRGGGGRPEAQVHHLARAPVTVIRQHCAATAWLVV